MAELLMRWVNSINLSTQVTSIETQFSNLYLYAEILHAQNLINDEDLGCFSQKYGPRAKAGNANRLRGHLKRSLGIELQDKQISQIVKEERGAAVKLLYNIKCQLEPDTSPPKRVYVNLRDDVVSSPTTRAPEASTTSRRGKAENPIVKQAIQDKLPKSQLDMMLRLSHFYEHMLKSDAKSRELEAKEAEEILDLRRNEALLRREQRAAAAKQNEKNNEEMIKAWKANQQIKVERERQELSFELAMQQRRKFAITSSNTRHMWEQRWGIDDYEKNLKRLGVGGDEVQSEYTTQLLQDQVEGRDSPQDKLERMESAVATFMQTGTRESAGYIQLIRSKMKHDKEAKREREQRRRLLVLEQGSSHEALQQQREMESFMAQLRTQASEQRSKALARRRLLHKKQQKRTVQTAKARLAMVARNAEYEVILQDRRKDAQQRWKDCFEERDKEKQEFLKARDAKKARKHRRAIAIGTDIVENLVQITMLVISHRKVHQHLPNGVLIPSIGWRQILKHFIDGSLAPIMASLSSNSYDRGLSKSNSVPGNLGYGEQVLEELKRQHIDEKYSNGLGIWKLDSKHEAEYRSRSDSLNSIHSSTSMDCSSGTVIQTVESVFASVSRWVTESSNTASCHKRYVKALPKGVSPVCPLTSNEKTLGVCLIGRPLVGKSSLATLLSYYHGFRIISPLDIVSETVYWYEKEEEFQKANETVSMDTPEVVKNGDNAVTQSPLERVYKSTEERELVLKVGKLSIDAINEKRHPLEAVGGMLEMAKLCALRVQASPGHHWVMDGMPQTTEQAHCLDYCLGDSMKDAYEIPKDITLEQFLQKAKKGQLFKSNNDNDTTNVLKAGPEISKSNISLVVRLSQNLGSATSVQSQGSRRPSRQGSHLSFSRQGSNLSVASVAQQELELHETEGLVFSKENLLPHESTGKEGEISYNNDDAHRLFDNEHERIGQWYSTLCCYRTVCIPHIGNGTKAKEARVHALHKARKAVFSRLGNTYTRRKSQSDDETSLVDMLMWQHSLACHPRGCGDEIDIKHIQRLGDEWKDSKNQDSLVTKLSEAVCGVENGLSAAIHNAQQLVKCGLHLVYGYQLDVPDGAQTEALNGYIKKGFLRTCIGQLAREYSEGKIAGEFETLLWSVIEQHIYCVEHIIDSWKASSWIVKAVRPICAGFTEIIQQQTKRYLECRNLVKSFYQTVIENQEDTLGSKFMKRDSCGPEIEQQSIHGVIMIQCPEELNGIPPVNRLREALSKAVGIYSRRSFTKGSTCDSIGLALREIGESYLATLSRIALVASQTLEQVVVCRIHSIEKTEKLLEAFVRSQDIQCREALSSNYLQMSSMVATSSPYAEALHDGEYVSVPDGQAVFDTRGGVLRICPKQLLGLAVHLREMVNQTQSGDDVAGFTLRRKSLEGTAEFWISSGLIKHALEYASESQIILPHAWTKLAHLQESDVKHSRRDSFVENQEVLLEEIVCVVRNGATNSEVSHASPTQPRMRFGAETSVANQNNNMCSLIGFIHSLACGSLKTLPTLDEIMTIHKNFANVDAKNDRKLTHSEFMSVGIDFNLCENFHNSDANNETERLMNCRILSEMYWTCLSDQESMLSYPYFLLRLCFHPSPTSTSQYPNTTGLYKAFLVGRLLYEFDKGEGTGSYPTDCWKAYTDGKCQPKLPFESCKVVMDKGGMGPNVAETFLNRVYSDLQKEKSDELGFDELLSSRPWQSRYGKSQPGQPMPYVVHDPFEVLHGLT